MDTVPNHPEVIDHFVTAYEAAKQSGSILLEAQCFAMRSLYRGEGRYIKGRYGRGKE